MCSSDLFLLSDRSSRSGTVAQVHGIRDAAAAEARLLPTASGRARIQPPSSVVSRRSPSDQQEGSRDTAAVKPIDSLSLPVRAAMVRAPRWLGGWWHVQGGEILGRAAAEGLINPLLREVKSV